MSENGGWTRANHELMSSWAQHMQALTRAYQKSRKFWQYTSIALFIVTEFFLAHVLFFQLLQVNSPAQRCLIGPYAVCTTLYYFSLLCTVIGGVLAAISSFVKPEEKKSECGNVANNLNYLNKYIVAMLHAIAGNRPPYTDFAQLTAERFRLIMEGAPDPVSWFRLEEQTELPVFTPSAAQEESLAVLQLAANAELNRLSQRPLGDELVIPVQSRDS